MLWVGCRYHCSSDYLGIYCIPISLGRMTFWGGGYRDSTCKKKKETALLHLAQHFLFSCKKAHISFILSLVHSFVLFFILLHHSSFFSLETGHSLPFSSSSRRKRRYGGQSYTCKGHSSGSSCCSAL